MISIILATLLVLNPNILAEAQGYTITSWTEYAASTTPQTWSFHRGFYSQNKIYIVGHSTKPMVFDIPTQQWAWYEISFAGKSFDSSFDGQYGTSINGVYYWKGYSGIEKFDPNANPPTYDKPFAADSGWHKCLTSNGKDTVYVIDDNAFKKLNVEALNPVLESGPTVPYSTSMAECTYYKGVIYLFGGGTTAISKIDIGENNENFQNANWQTLSITMPAAISQGEAILAGNGLIYIGGFRDAGYLRKIYSFDPTNEEAGLIAETDFNEERDKAGLVFSEYDNRLYVLTGRLKNDLEYSNHLTGIIGCSREWADEYACIGSSMGDLPILDKDECISECLQHSTCECVTWLKGRPATPCRLETGPTATHRGAGAQYEAMEMSYCAEGTSVPVDCVEGTTYTAWIGCNAACDSTGEETRTRLGDVAESNGGAACSSTTETQSCNGPPCPIPCAWSEWSDVGECSKYCGNGQQEQKRVHNVEAQHGGADCTGDSQKYVDCNGHDCCPNGIGTFDWKQMTGGVDMTMIPDMTLVEFEVYSTDLTLHVNVELEYLGKTSANNQREANFGTSYVLDFEDFDAHSDSIFKPGTCQNRKESSFSNVLFNDMWTYSSEPQNANGINSATTLAYPPSDWTLFMKNEATVDGCDTIVYERTFTWEELRECSSYDGERYNPVVKEGNNLVMRGVFYINVVSPFWNTGDYGYYRVYQLLSKPFTISVRSTVEVLGSTGINLFTMWVIAVYKEDEETDFRLVVMTESADYLTLQPKTNPFFQFEKADSNTNTIDSTYFTEPTAAENDVCLTNRQFICTQLWNIKVEDKGCITGEGGIGTDFSGEYSLGFDPICTDITDTHCTQFLNDHLEIKNNLVLSADLHWKDEICDPKVFTLQFMADMLFYKTDLFTDGEDIATVDSSHLFQAGVDTIYVEIDTRFPDNTFTIFNTVLTNVYICTFAPTETVYTFQDVQDEIATLDQMGCLNNNKDDSLADIVNTIYPVQDPNIVNFELYTEETETDIVQFSFLIPEEVTRDTLYIHAQIEVELIEGPDNIRRRMLLDVNTANQISHFGHEIGISHNKNKNKKPMIPNQPINNPIPSSPVYLSLKSSWVIAIGCLLAFILTVNICFMGYVNLCKRRRKGYESVKYIDSEFDSEAQMLDNQ